MKKALALFGLVLIPLGIGTTALAKSGSDSSGTHSYNVDCVGEDLIFSNTGVGKIRFYWPLAMGSGGTTLNAGESENIGTPGVDAPAVGTYYEVWFEDPVGSNKFYGLDEGNFPDCAAGEEIPDVAPALLSECRGDVWWLVHPGGNFAYRMSTGDILYVAGYTSNNPAAVYGEVAIDAGVNEVSTADDFNNVAEYTRPDCSADGGTTTTTEPTTTVPGEPAPNTPGLNPVTGEGFVAPGAQVGPGAVTFGASGFAPGEQVTATLFSTPRELGVVTADASGNVSITFELLASDGAGPHHVEFSGPSGTVSVPFTLVLPAAPAGLPETR